MLYVVLVVEELTVPEPDSSVAALADGFVVVFDVAVVAVDVAVGVADVRAVTVVPVSMDRLEVTRNGIYETAVHAVRHVRLLDRYLCFRKLRSQRYVANRRFVTHDCT